MPFADLVDVEKEKERLAKEQKRLEGEIKRCTGMLNNPKFVDKAPQAKVDEEKAKLEKYEGDEIDVTELDYDDISDLAMDFYNNVY